MQGYLTKLEEDIAHEDRIQFACVMVCRWDVVLVLAMAQRVMSRTEKHGREMGEILKTMALADAGVFAFLGFDQVRGL